MHFPLCFELLKCVNFRKYFLYKHVKIDCCTGIEPQLVQIQFVIDSHAIFAEI